jgi:hypothetical protein
MKTCNNGITRDMTTAEIAAWERSVAGVSPTATDADVAAALVAKAQAAAIAAIEARTAALLDAGFEYPVGSGHFHSLDDRRISTYGETQKNKNAFTDLPVITNGKKVIRLANATAIDAFYAAGLARSMAIRVVGAELIEDANAATTTAELEAIVDDRT